MNLAVFASGGGSNFQAILRRIRSGDLTNACVVLVVSNNSRCGALELARQNSIAAVHLSSQTHPDHVAFENTLLDLLCTHQVEIILLAGYMKLLPKVVIRRFPKRILNIHPALLPQYGGQGMYGIKVHEAVVRSGDRESGATVHWVNENYDDGPIAAQSRVPVLAGDTAGTLAARVLQAEHDLYWRVVDALANDREINASEPWTKS